MNVTLNVVVLDSESIHPAKRRDIQKQLNRVKIMGTKPLLVFSMRVADQGCCTLQSKRVEGLPGQLST